MSDRLLTLNGQIANPRSKMYRRCFIKRRLLTTGLYEDDWLEVTKDVMKWGSIRKEVDATRVNSFKFSNFQMKFSNKEGLYNPNDDENSYWYHYGDQQRTLVKIEAGFVYEKLEADGIWDREEIPGEDGVYWDDGVWDADDADWDSNSGANILFMGLISGDIAITGNGEVNLPMVHLTEAFRLFSAYRLSGYSAALTASSFIELLRDQQDDTGAYIFRPFFGNTTTGWVIQTTTANYSNLNTTTSDDVRDSTVWDIIQTLAESENFVPYVTRDGKFTFTSRNYANTAAAYQFFGAGGFSSEYGQTIKKISWFGRRHSKYYSRVSVQWRSDDTASSFEIRESTFRVSGSSDPWTLGERTLDVSNFWIPTITTAQVVADELFDEYSALKREIEFTTSFVPQLDLLDRVQITYDPSRITPNSLWDLYDWADDTAVTGPTDLIFDASSGDALKLSGDEFLLISMELNLDTGESKFIGRE